MTSFISQLKIILILCFATHVLAQNQLHSNEKYWVFFKDKKPTSLSKTVQIENLVKTRISKRALKRRAKVRTYTNLIDTHDLPVSIEYLHVLESMGHKPVIISNWLNSASFWLSKSEITEISKLPFVKKIMPVGSMRREPQPDDIKPASPAKQLKSESHLLDYGQSLIQNELINVLAVHDLGITGTDVWIGILDSGFKLDNHEAFEQIKIISEYDFINNDGTTKNEDGQDSSDQHNHGTWTLSTIGGFKEGQLIGTAYRASFLLAKTEIAPNPDQRAELDYWVAGLEWLENQGADIVSSSVGHLDFFTPADMDGDTAPTTIAADLAVSRGVVVLNSAGNEGNDPWRIIIAPADGDSVIAVGAVNTRGDSLWFSSVGPTADGRIKPDVVALGSSVYTAIPSTPKISSAYNYFSGTSFSCPLVAGVAALILSAHPYLTPMEVRDALRLTANRAASPDNKFGWGLVNAFEAVLFHGTAFSNIPMVFVNSNNNLVVKTKIASKAGIDPNKVLLIYAKSDGNFNHSIAMSREPENNLFAATIPEIINTNSAIHFYFSSTDSNVVKALHPYNAPNSSFSATDLLVAVNRELPDLPSTFHLAQNYPNPFNPETKIEYELPKQNRITLVIFNLLGQKIRELLNNISKPAGRHSIIWDGRDESGKPVPTGVYFYRLKADNFSDVKKMLLVR